MKVFAVSAGHYSDYGIVGIFSTEEKAREFMRAFPAEGYSDEYNDLEEYELDMPLPEPVSRGLSYFVVRMRRNGDVDHVRGQGYEESAPEKMSDWSNYGYEYPRGSFTLPREQEVANFYVWARDKDHAVKVANERRIQFLASEHLAP